jgi:peptidoglycan/xylan/chitin deacetylase (PgdA/CDA1 family)
MRPFVVCIHDAAPPFARETAAMIRDLAPLVGRDLAFGVVPDWHGAWPLDAHPGFCSMVQDAAAELLLHGCDHRRRTGRGPVSWLAEGSDEMNGLTGDDLTHTLARGQRTFIDAFGAAARGFIAPAWQRGDVRAGSDVAYVMGFFSLDAPGRRVPLATWTWDCGRWRTLGHVGHATGRLLHALGGRTPVLAIHPRDLGRGYWPAILRLTRSLLDAGYEPRTPSDLLRADVC